MFGRVTKSGGYMAEALLCQRHYADPALVEWANVTANDAEDASADRTWHRFTEADNVNDPCLECKLEANALTEVRA